MSLPRRPFVFGDDHRLAAADDRHNRDLPLCDLRPGILALPTGHRQNTAAAVFTASDAVAVAFAQYGEENNSPRRHGATEKKLNFQRFKKICVHPCAPVANLRLRASVPPW